MSTSSGILEAVKTLAPAFAGHPVGVWHAAREGTQRVADVLPDAPVLDHVKALVRKHPILATCAVLALGGYLSGRGLGGGKPTA
jgi:hypothetical protein